MNFGEYLKQLRMERRFTLRCFANMIGMDPANYSKVERGKIDMPHEKLRSGKLRDALSLAEGSGEWEQLIELASIERGLIPERYLTDSELLNKLPALFRTLDADIPDEEKALRLAEIFRRA